MELVRWRIGVAGFGVAAVAVVATGVLMLRPASAGSCTQGCGAPTGICSGSDTAACAGGNVLCTSPGTSCPSGGVTWYDPVVRGSAMGSSQITWTPVSCRLIIPCITSGGVITSTSCSYNNGLNKWTCVVSFLGSCQGCTAGSGTIDPQDTCQATSCSEE